MVWQGRPGEEASGGGGPVTVKRSCKTCRYGPECELGLTRYMHRGVQWVCDPGDFGPPEKQLRDVWEPRGMMKPWEEWA